MIICTRTLGHVVRHVGAVGHVAGLGGLEVVGEEALAGGDGDGERVEAAVLLPAPAPANTRRPGHLERQSTDYKVIGIYFQQVLNCSLSFNCQIRYGKY